MEFKRGQFNINGLHSEEFNVYMRDRPERLSAGRVIELRERPGNDSIVVDYGYHKNVEWLVSCYAKVRDLSDVANQEDLIKSWLDMGNYSDFEYYFDQQYIYQAIVISPPKFTGTRRNGNLIPFEFSISLRPFKENHSGRRWMLLENNIEIHNNKKYLSKPKIHIIGSGDISFWINDTKYDLVGVENEIIIDSRLEESYRMIKSTVTPQDQKTKFRDFPLLPTDWFKVRWSGNVKEFNLLPRWWTKV